MQVLINTPENVELLTEKLKELAASQQTVASRFLSEVQVVPPDALSAPHRYWEVQNQVPLRGLRANDPIIDDYVFFMP